MAESTVENEVVQDNLRYILEKIRKCYELADLDQKNPEFPPRLVAVSKLKPVELIRSCYEAGHKVFGENYVQELIDKAQSSEIREFCPEIQWHFIGTLQTNKIAKISSAVPNLACVETVTSEKLAKALNSAWRKSNVETVARKLPVMVQVNTSGEEQKSGLDPDQEALDVADMIIDECENLHFRGFMTIGALARSLESSEKENPDFHCLLDTRSRFCARRGIEVTNVELSMGMSNDFEEAIRMGSTNVRIGSTIFGLRPAKKK